VGVLIALYERAVGFYASLIRVNAYHQPGVEAGKKAAASVITMQREILKHLGIHGKQPSTVAEIARSINAEDDLETVFKICEHLAANGLRNIVKTPGPNPFTATYAKA
jgi:glucose-6-phosphate isomerase